MKNRNLVIGIFVVAGLSLFTAAIFLIGSQNKAFERHIDFYTDLADVNGLSKGTKIRVAGFDAGEVTDIVVPVSPSAKFRLKLRIIDRVHALIRTDSVVTIATSGVVGDRFLMVRQGTEEASEAAPYSTLKSKEPLEMAEILERSVGLLNNASGTMKTVGDKLNGTLDAVKTTVDNANDVVMGIKQGKGTVGMLLRDEVTANDVRQTVTNLKQTSATIDHASQQADALVTDFQSRHLTDKADQTISSAQSAVHHLDVASQQIQTTVARVLEPDAQGVDAATNIRQSISNLNQATGNMSEDTEALKRGFFFRGFFKRRGYYSLANLNPEQYRKDKLFSHPENRRVWLNASRLFVKKQTGAEMLTEEGKLQIGAAIAQLGDSAAEMPLVIEGYSTVGEPGEQLAISRSRSLLVRDYLHSHFQIDLIHLGVVPLRNVPPPHIGKDTWDGIAIVLLEGTK